MLILREMQKIVSYINICNANFKSSQLYGTGPWHLNMAYSRYITNKKDLFIGQFQANAIKLKYTNRIILTFREIGSICLFYIHENRNILTTHVDNILY